MPNKLPGCVKSLIIYIDNKIFPCLFENLLPEEKANKRKQSGFALFIGEIDRHSRKIERVWPEDGCSFSREMEVAGDIWQQVLKKQSELPSFKPVKQNGKEWNAACIHIAPPLWIVVQDGFCNSSFRLIAEQAVSFLIRCDISQKTEKQTQILETLAMFSRNLIDHESLKPENVLDFYLKKLSRNYPIEEIALYSARFFPSRLKFQREAVAPERKWNSLKKDFFVSEKGDENDILKALGLAFDSKKQNFIPVQLFPDKCGLLAVKIKKKSTITPADSLILDSFFKLLQLALYPQIVSDFSRQFGQNLVAGLSFKIGDPLASAFFQLKKLKKDSGESSAKLDVFEKELKRIEELLKTFGRTSLLLPEEPVNFDLKDILQQAREVIPQLNEQFDISADGLQPDCVVKSYKSLLLIVLHEVFMNIITHSRKTEKNRVSVALSASTEEKDKENTDKDRVTVLLSSKNGNDTELGKIVELRIEDNGDTLPGNRNEKEMDHLFKPGFKNNLFSPGAGFGLSTCRYIVEKLIGGKITAHTVNPGLVIMIKIPLAEKAGNIIPPDFDKAEFDYIIRGIAENGEFLQQKYPQNTETGKYHLSSDPDTQEDDCRIAKILDSIDPYNAEGIDG